MRPNDEAAAAEPAAWHLSRQAAPSNGAPTLRGLRRWGLPVALLLALPLAACGSGRSRPGSGSNPQDDGDDGGFRDLGIRQDASGRDSGQHEGQDLEVQDEDLGSGLCSATNPHGLCAGGLVCRDGQCVEPQCSPQHPYGRCPPEQTCVDGACRTTSCSSENPSGTCPEPDQVCVDGTCERPQVRLVGVQVSRDALEPPAEDGAPEPPGQNNGLIDAGEVVELLPLVENSSGTPYLSVSGELSCAADGVTVLEGRQSYDDLPVGTVDQPDRPFRVRTRQELPNGALISCTLALADSREGQLTPLPLKLGVRSGLHLSSAELFVDDDELGQSEGDGDHLIDPGERVELVIDLSNDGVVPIPLPEIPGDSIQAPLQGQQVVAQIVSNSEQLEVLHLDNPPVYEGQMAPGETARSAADFDLVLSDDVQAGRSICFELLIELQGAGAARLYGFREWRCFEVSGPFGEPCVPAAERCNGADDDCDGQTDEGLPVNACGTCGELPLEVCDGVDNDCDGLTDEELEADADDDGYPGPGSCAEATDCDDGDPAVHPGAPERCNGEDDNCDGRTDEGLPVNACGTCGDPPAERCNGVDDDCDGQIDEGLEVDQDGDGYPGPGSCRESTDCDDLDFAVHPGAPELCDGEDDDCDGETDEGCDTRCAEAQVVEAADQQVSVSLAGEDQTFEFHCSMLGADTHRDTVLALDITRRQRMQVDATSPNPLLMEITLMLLQDDCLTPVEDGCATRAMGSEGPAHLDLTLDSGRYYLVVGDVDPLNLPLSSVDLAFTFGG